MEPNHLGPVLQSYGQQLSHSPGRWLQLEAGGVNLHAAEVISALTGLLPQRGPVVVERSCITFCGGDSPNDDGPFRVNYSPPYKRRYWRSSHAFLSRTGAIGFGSHLGRQRGQTIRPAIAPPREPTRSINLYSSSWLRSLYRKSKVSVIHSSPSHREHGLLICSPIS